MTNFSLNCLPSNFSGKTEPQLPSLSDKGFCFEQKDLWIIQNASVAQQGVIASWYRLANDLRYRPFGQESEIKSEGECLPILLFHGAKSGCCVYKAVTLLALAEIDLERQ